MTPALTTGTALDPRPISDALQRHFDQVLSQIPSGKKAAGGIAITTAGVEASIAAKIPVKGIDLTATAWGGKDWSSGWLAGARIGFAF